MRTVQSLTALVRRRLGSGARPRRRTGARGEDRSARRTGARGGIELRPADRALLDELDRRLRDTVHPAVALLGGPRPGWLPQALTEAQPGARVTRFDVTSLTRSELHAELAGVGPFELIVDSTRDGTARVRRLRDVFFHLRPGGAYVARNVRAGSTPARAGDLASFVARLVSLKDGGAREQDSQAQRDLQRLAAATGRVALEWGYAVLENRVHALAKLREHEVDTVLALRGSEVGRVLERRPPVEFTVRCTVRENRPERGRNMPFVYDVPAVSLREYCDVVCGPGQVVIKDNLILPDTYRHHQRPRLKNLYTDELSPLFATPRDDLSAPEPLTGPHYYLDSEFRGHFGHAMTEVLSRLWAWRAAKAAEPRLKALMALNKGREIAGFERELFMAAGIDPDDLVLVRGPVRVRRLLAATPMLSMPAYVHPDLADMWGGVGRALAVVASEREYPSRVFCSRRIDKRPCHNAAEVEAMFGAHGFEVIYPEDFSLADQAMIVRRAEVVAGFAGSGLFSLCLSGAPKRVVIVSPESYTARNEYQIAAVLGHDVDLVLSEPDTSDSVHYWESGFTFDFSREGRHLEAILSSL